MASRVDADGVRVGRDVDPVLLAARCVAALCALLVAVPMFGLIDLGTLFGLVDQSYVWSVSLETSWGAFFTFVLGGSYAWVAVAPSRPWPGIALLCIAGSVLILIGVLAAQPALLVVGIPVLMTAALLGSLTSDAAGRPSRALRVRWPALVLAVAGLGLWFPYVLHAVQGSQSAGDRPWTDYTNGISHWPVQAATGTTLALAALVMAVWAPSVALFRFAVSVSTTLIGVAMLAYPDRDGATESALWAVVITLWGTAVALGSPPAHASARLPGPERAG